MSDLTTTTKSDVTETSTRALSLAQEQYDYLLLDGSGSMMDKWWEMLEALDSYVSTLTHTGTRSHIYLSIFTSPTPDNLDLVARDCPIDQWVPLLQQPVGSDFQGTPLYDAIEHMGTKLRALNPKRASIVICTDGQEGGSRFCDEQRARAILDWMRSKGWSVTFIGCDFNNFSSAKKLGATPSAAIGVSKEHLTEAVQELAKKRHAYGVTGQPVHWSEGEQKQFGGRLADMRDKS